MTGPIPIDGFLKQQRQERGSWLVPNLANAVAALRNEPALSGLVAYDEMLSLTMLVRPARAFQKSDNSSTFKPRPITDTDVSCYANRQSCDCPGCWKTID